MPEFTEDDIDAAGKAMLRDLAKIKNYSHGCLFLGKPTYPDVVVRGHIDLYALAKAALTAIQKRKR